MPKEGKKRGRRGLEQQRKEREIKEDFSEIPNKRRRIAQDDESFVGTDEREDGFIAFEDVPKDVEGEQQGTFYGLLTEEEQAYYANVNNKITANDFENDQDRASFIEAVYRESAGKEIKLASSQSCSRHLERLMKLSTPGQLRDLFVAFLQDLDYLMQHRFGSHCVETLFTESAQYVIVDVKHKKQENTENEFEALFLEATAKIKSNVGFMLTETFASHTLRVLLAILLGEPVSGKTAQATLASRKKEGIELDDGACTDVKPRRVPISFQRAQQDLIKSVVAGLDTTYLRALATSPTGNPVLQMLLTADLKGQAEETGERYLILRKLVADLEFDPESESSRWVASLIYDTTGAYLVQSLVRSLPGKMFKKMYKNLFCDRIGKLAKNDIASYVAISIFNRLGGDDLRAAGPALMEELHGMAERQRLAPLRTWIEALSRRGAYYPPLRDNLITCFGERMDKSPAKFLGKMLGLDLRMDQTTGELPNAGECIEINTQGALLAQTLLTNNSVCGLIQNALVSMSIPMFQTLARDASASRIIQTALTADTSTKPFLRSLMPKFDHGLVALALDKCGSHVLDALWVGTNGLHYLKEKFAAVLAASQHEIRDSLYGRIVWRNWHMDLYIRKRRDWVNVATQMAPRPQEGVNEIEQEEKPTRKKTPLELARERAAQKQAQTNRARHTAQQSNANMMPLSASAASSS